MQTFNHISIFNSILTIFSLVRSSVVFGLFFVSICFNFALAGTIVCSATLNSNNEIEALKQKIGDHAQFVELTDFASSLSEKDPWLKRACEQNINCDVLVISGHFTDHFLEMA